MARPQTEDGYTRIANELLDAILRFGFSKRQFGVLLAVVRKTYGYNKKADELSATQISAMTGIPRQHVVATLGELVSLQVVIKVDGRHANSLALNKDYSAWGSPETGLPGGTSPHGETAPARTVPPSPETGLGVVPKQDSQLVPKQDGGSPETGLALVLKQDPQKTTPKDNSKREGEKRRASGAPKAFPITDRMRAHAKAKGLPNGRWLEETTEHFLDHHRAKGSTFLDWEAAWRTWLRNEVKFGRVPGRPQSDLLDKVTYVDSDD